MIVICKFYITVMFLLFCCIIDADNDKVDIYTVMGVL